MIFNVYRITHMWKNKCYTSHEMIKDLKSILNYIDIDTANTLLLYICIKGEIHLYKDTDSLICY